MTTKALEIDDHFRKEKVDDGELSAVPLLLLDSTFLSRGFILSTPWTHFHAIFSFLTSSQQ